MTELSSPPRTRVIHNPTVLTLRIVEEIERQRKSGALQQITIPPCPAKLLAQFHIACQFYDGLRQI